MRQTVWPAAGLVLSLLSAASHAQIYKWVDAQGRTHYSDSKEEAGKATVKEVRVAPGPGPAPQDAEPAWKKREAEFQRRQKQQASAAPERALPMRHSPHNYLSETDAAKCGLARDILSGAARHPNGKPVDAYDREVANADIKNFCR